MKIVETGRDEVMRPILEHEKTQEIVDAVAQADSLRAFLMHVIRDFPTLESLADRKPNVRKLSNDYANSKAERNSAARICGAVETLFRGFDPSHVRGALLEALIQRAIQTRYGAREDWLENNIEFKVQLGAASHTTSTSVDVVGVDTASKVGECHDCKVRAKKFDLKWLKELRDDIAPFGFRVGIATADSARLARRDLQKAGFSLDASTVLVASDSWHLPLRP